ncbi:MAG: glutathione S-transferase family protein [Steroidobacteraceae bacterium]|nr:glutathione S-transferase family protein [Steroidobacteraceae bacterium]MDW8258500.1 glutathione S-transferase family protein [Gammaproteobacteria bacterium]
MKVYGSPVSPYVSRVLMAGKAKGIPLTVDNPPGGNFKSPEYLALNPMGKMPTLADGDFALAESGTILEYLEDLGQGKPLLPKEPRARALARLIARITDIYLVPQFGGFFKNMNPAQRNQAEVDASIAGTKSALGYLEHYADPVGPYLIGRELTLADCTLLPTLMVGCKFVYIPFGLGNALDATPKLKRWFDGMQSSSQWSDFCKEYCDSFAAFLKQRMGG